MGCVGSKSDVDSDDTVEGSPGEYFHPRPPAKLATVEKLRDIVYAQLSAVLPGVQKREDVIGSFISREEWGAHYGVRLEVVCEPGRIELSIIPIAIGETTIDDWEPITKADRIQSLVALGQAITAEAKTRSPWRDGPWGNLDYFRHGHAVLRSVLREIAEDDSSIPDFGEIAMRGLQLYLLILLPLFECCSGQLDADAAFAQIDWSHKPVEDAMRDGEPVTTSALVVRSKAILDAAELPRFDVAGTDLTCIAPLKGYQFAINMRIHCDDGEISVTTYPMIWADGGWQAMADIDAVQVQIFGRKLFNGLSEREPWSKEVWGDINPMLEHGVPLSGFTATGLVWKDHTPQMPRIDEVMKLQFRLWQIIVNPLLTITCAGCTGIEAYQGVDWTETHEIVVKTR